METKILPAEGEALSLARALIGRGEVVAFPTETVYGLGANAFDEEAVKRIFALKGRPSDNPLIVHVHAGYDISPLIDGEPPYARALREAFLPGPLTMVYPSTGKVAPAVSCGLDTLAIRVPSSPAAQAFLSAVDLPVAAPSANLSKHVSPVTAGHVFDDFGGKIGLILDGGPCAGGIESTVLDCTGEIPLILRAGLVTREEIARVAGDCGVYRMQAGEKPKSPGMAHKHYAPRVPSLFCTTAAAAREACRAEAERGGRPVVLCAHADVASLSGCEVLDLGRTGREMAKNLYAFLREGEKGASLLIGLEPKETDGVMAGVLNRFRRAFGAE